MIRLFEDELLEVPEIKRILFQHYERGCPTHDPTER